MRTPKRYACSQCGYEQVRETSHYDEIVSYGCANVCSECPPKAKYTDLGGQTVWQCLENPPSLIRTIVIDGDKLAFDSGTGQNVALLASLENPVRFTPCLYPRPQAAKLRVREATDADYVRFEIPRPPKITINVARARQIWNRCQKGFPPADKHIEANTTVDELNQIKTLWLNQTRYGEKSKPMDVLIDLMNGIYERKL